MDIKTLVGRLPRLMHSFMNERLKDNGLSSMAFPYLMELNIKDGQSMSELTQKTLTDKANTSRVIVELEKKGLLERKKDITDGRLSRIFLTDKGKKTVSEIKDIMGNWHNKLIKDINSEELEVLNKVMNKIYNNAINSGKD